MTSMAVTNANDAMIAVFIAAFCGLILGMIIALMKLNIARAARRPWRLSADRAGWIIPKRNDDTPDDLACWATCRTCKRHVDIYREAAYHAGNGQWFCNDHAAMADHREDPR